MRRFLPLALAALMSAAPTHAALCTPDTVPAATLLMPYFEVAQCGDPGSSRTQFTVANIGPAPRLAHVTLWTNAAVPAFDFDLYLGGYGSRHLDLYELLCNGLMPSSGPGVSEPGRLAQPEVAFDQCNAGSDPAGGAPVYATLAPALRNELQALFSGAPSPATGLCSAVREADAAATQMTGYITVDSVDRCNAPVGGEAGFAQALDDANALTGHATLFDPGENFSFGYPAVAIEAGANDEFDGRRTFYDFVAAGADAREPLPTDWGADFAPGATGTMSLVIWRGTGQVGVPFACDTRPAWYPLDFSNRSGFSSRGAMLVDDDGHAQILLRSPPLAPLATQRRSVTRAIPHWLRLNLQHSRLPGAVPGGQGYLIAVADQGGRYETEHPAIAFDSGCSGPGFDHVSPGRGESP